MVMYGHDISVTEVIFLSRDHTGHRYDNIALAIVAELTVTWFGQSHNFALNRHE